MPAVSVLINNRNHAPFLKACIDSVLGQTRAPDEVIVFDDGSTDGSRAILAGYSPRVQVIEGGGERGSPMQNQAHSIATAFAASTGDIIFLLDADDIFGREHIEAYLRAFARSQSVIMVQAPLLKIDGAGRPIGLEHDPRRHVRNYLRHIYETHEINIFYPTSSLAFRRSYLQQRLPLDRECPVELWPDAQLALVAPHFGEVVTLDEPHTYWRRHARSHTVLRTTSVYTQMQMNRRYYNAFCAQRGLPQVRAWRSRQHIKRWLRHLCPPGLLRRYQDYKFHRIYRAVG